METNSAPCPICGSHFRAQGRRADAIYCTKECQRRAAERRKAPRLVERNREYIRGIKSSTPCADCGVQYHFAVMEFDHILPGKRAGVSELVTRGATIKRIDEELALCELCCANCHRMRTFSRLGLTP